MIAALVVVTLAASVSTARPCDGVVDRTAQCSPPKDGGAPVLADVKPPAAAPAGAFPVDELPASLGIASFSLAFGGGAALVLGLVPTPSNDGEVFAQEIAVYTGAGLLIWSALVGSGALALWAFDPSTGVMRVPIDPAPGAE